MAIDDAVIAARKPHLEIPKCKLAQMFKKQRSKQFASAIVDAFPQNIEIFKPQPDRLIVACWILRA